MLFHFIKILQILCKGKEHDSQIRKPSLRRFTIDRKAINQRDGQLSNHSPPSTPQMKIKEKSIQRISNDVRCITLPSRKSLSKDLFYPNQNANTSQLIILLLANQGSEMGDDQLINSCEMRELLFSCPSLLLLNI
ncbi:UNVERIFIED_CONTAM: hypothetical protein NCL1_35973 [Trichonephila clavipes]